MKSKPRITAALLLALVALVPATSLAQKQKQEPDDKREARTDVPEEVPANRREQADEDVQGEIPYYNNFLTTYRLGPEDVISVNVFDLPKYSKSGIVVPPDGRIDYYLVRGGIQVSGKTTQQVADEIARHLDEYIIDPKVNVSLDKAMSARYGVIGDVGQPGIRVMTRRLSVYEALSEAGGILPTGRKQVFVLHWNADRTLDRKLIDVAAIEKGKAADNYFLRPGDQIFVPGNKWKRVESIIKLAPVLTFARVFAGGF